jgi:hypothetical protein
MHTCVSLWSAAMGILTRSRSVLSQIQNAPALWKSVWIA